VVLQNAKAYDDQDEELGMAHAHIEVGGVLSLAMAVWCISLRRMELELSLSESAQKLGITGGIAGH
jgi:hypothetical protein